VDEETFNMSVRTFLKALGVTAQREIERAVVVTGTIALS